MSVVVSTHNRPERLACLLAGLRAQTLTSFEVIVVDNGSDPPTGAMIARETARGELRLRSIRHELTRGPSGGRNSGWQLAAAPLIAFIDDDCVPRSDWLSCAVALADTNPRAIVQGRTEPAPEEVENTTLTTHTVRIERLGPQFETCNIFYPRELLAALGGFDERYGLRPAGEDTDLAWRAIEAGRRAVFAENAVVYHAVEELGTVGMLRRAARWTETARLFAAHPKARSMLFRGIFWNVWHYLLIRSVLALLLPAPARRLILWRHASELRRRARRAGAGPASIPFLVIHDAIEVVAVARGAARHRTLLL